MNKKLKILLGVVIAFALFALYCFCAALTENNYNALVALGQTWLAFLLPIGMIVVFMREKRIYQMPIKEISAQVVNLQRVYEPLHNMYRHVISYKTDEQNTINFEVSVEIFNKSAIGQKGILSYRERKGKYYFVYFSNLDAVNNG